MSRQLDLNNAISVKTALKVLPPGMYTARYLGTYVKGEPADSSTAARANIPLAFSQAPIQMSGLIEFISPEHVSNQTLAAPGDYLLLNVKGGDAVVAVSKYSPRALTDNVDVHWRIEPLNQQLNTKSQPSTNNQPSERATPAKASPITEAAAEQFALLGHVERQGDVRVSAGEWLGDPKSKARLEGFQVIWPQKPDEVTVVAGCKAGQATQQVKNDEFLGTRQKATPITQLAVCLNGPGASNYQLNGEAAFSDGSRQQLGDPKAVAGSNGSYLVAVRLSVAPNQPATTPNQPASPASSARSRWLDPENTYIRQR
tara:strand:- start:16280 stop:17221 length:942 start_codon:yes stop_codon:yes gene_type:complete